MLAFWKSFLDQNSIWYRISFPSTKNILIVLLSHFDFRFGNTYYYILILVSDS